MDGAGRGVVFTLVVPGGWKLSGASLSVLARRPPQATQEPKVLRYPEVRREGWGSGSASLALSAS